VYISRKMCFPMQQLRPPHKLSTAVTNNLSAGKESSLRFPVKNILIKSKMPLHCSSRPSYIRNILFRNNSQENY